MPTTIQKVGGIIFSGFVALMITEAFEPSLTEKLNQVSQTFSFLNPNLILNLVGYSVGDFALDLLKAGILVASGYGIYKISKDD